MVFYTDCITFSLLFSSRVKQVWHKRLLGWGRMWTSWGPPPFPGIPTLPFLEAPRYMNASAVRTIGLHRSIHGPSTMDRTYHSLLSSSSSWSWTRVVITSRLTCIISCLNSYVPKKNSTVPRKNSVGHLSPHRTHWDSVPQSNLSFRNYFDIS